MLRYTSISTLLALAATTLAATTLSPAALAGQTLEGDYVQVSYNDYGNWNWTTEGAGLQCDFTGDGTFYDVTYPGTYYSAYAIEFSDSSSSYAYYSESAYGYASITWMPRTTCRPPTSWWPPTSTPPAT